MNIRVPRNNFDISSDELLNENNNNDSSDDSQGCGDLQVPTEGQFQPQKSSSSSFSSSSSSQTQKKMFI